MIKEYKNHPSIINIRNQTNLNVNTFATAEGINKIIKDMNPKNVTNPDKIPSNFIKLSANIVDSSLLIIIAFLKMLK